MLPVKFITIFSTVILLSTSVLAQNERLLLRTNGQKIPLKSDVRVQDALERVIIKSHEGRKVKHLFHDFQISSSVIDTLSYHKNFTGAIQNFVFDGQDVEMMWFEAPGDLIIKAAGFSCSATDDNINNSTVSLRLIKLNWNKEQMQNVAAPIYMGYYPSQNDGMNNSAPFPEEATGDWIDQSAGQFSSPPWDHEDYDLWSDNGSGVEIVPEVQMDEDGNPMPYSFQWVEMNELGYEPEIKAGEVFAIALINNGVDWTTQNDRIGFWTKSNMGYPGWKYYEAGRMSDDEPGWWARNYTWDFAVVVDIIGDRAPLIHSVTNLTTTLSTDPRTIEAIITDDNPAGGVTGIALAQIQYSINGGGYFTVHMADQGNNIWAGDLPGQDPSNYISYWVEAVDVDGNYSRSEQIEYFIFEPTCNQLLVFNGFDSPTGFPQGYYFGAGYWPYNWQVRAWDHDVWSYGPLTNDLVENYFLIIEISTMGPDHDNSEVIREWLELDEFRNYALFGDEWLGNIGYGWPGSDSPVEIPNGDFARDILGIEVYYSDIINAPTDSNEIRPIEDTEIGGPLYDYYTQLSADSGWTSPLFYNPNAEGIGNNRLDGVKFTNDVIVDVQGVSVADETAGQVFSIGGHRNLVNGNKIVFLAFDPLAVAAYNPYWWYGFMFASFQNSALTWTYPYRPGIIRIKTDIPGKFNLSQNYPNPFNPSTVIEYSIPVNSRQYTVSSNKQFNSQSTIHSINQSNAELYSVQLKVYDILGREVVTLVNEQQKPGVYQVDFDAAGLASGIYFYSLSAGKYFSTKKMLLLK